jgi:hypothetical protein
MDRRQELSETSHHGRIPLTLGWRLVVYVACAAAAWFGVAAAVVLIVAVADGGSRAHGTARHGRASAYQVLPHSGHPPGGVQPR